MRLKKHETQAARYWTILTSADMDLLRRTDNHPAAGAGTHMKVPAGANSIPSWPGFPLCWY